MKTGDTDPGTRDALEEGYLVASLIISLAHLAHSHNVVPGATWHIRVPGAVQPKVSHFFIELLLLHPLMPGMVTCQGEDFGGQKVPSG